MIIKEDGSYYIISCQKCGAEQRKHKSYATRYGEVYHFNPELKCNNCGFSAKIIYGSNSTPSSPSKGNLNNKDDKIQCPKCKSTPNRVVNQEHSNGKTNVGVVLTRGTEAAKHVNGKEVNYKEETANYPELSKKHIDVKLDTITAENTILKKLTKEKADNEKAKIMLVTNFGIVEGTIKPEVGENDVAKRISIGTAEIRGIHLAKLEKEVASSIIANNNCYVTILNARVTPFLDPTKILNFAVLNLFSDKIVGFAFGESIG